MDVSDKMILGWDWLQNSRIHQWQGLTWLSRTYLYLPAEKGNAVVIMDKGAYDDLVRKTLEKGKFHVIRRESLPDSVKSGKGSGWMQIHY